VRGEFLDLGGARLYYYAAGTRGTGNPVVFVHGFPTSGHLWNDVVSLMPNGNRIVVLDLLGYGRSDRPLGHRVDVLSHAARVVALLDELRIERACIVGHGIGGGIAQSVAVRHAKRISHLGLIDSVAFDHWPTTEGRIARATLPMLRFLPPRAITAVLRRNLLRGYADSTRAAHSLDLFLRPFENADGRDALLAHIRALTSEETADVGSQLAHVTVPTAIVCGEHDRIMPVDTARRLQAAIQGATLDVIPGVRHFTPEEAPRQVADAITALLAR
jgi:pimeloyl-ACP methyl ester carboxylesterase